MVDFMMCLGHMSIQASLVICVVLVIRQLFSMIHVSKKYIMFLWMIPFFFLVFPWKIESPIGFWSKAPADYRMEGLEENAAASETEEMPVIKMVKDTEESKAEQAKETIPDSTYKEANTGNTKSSMIPDEKASGKEKGNYADRFQTMLFLAGIVWGIGMVFLFCRSVISYWQLKKKALCSIHINDNVCYADDIPVPMVLGYFKPQIYIPSDMKEEHLEYVIAHERTHIRRKDTFTKVIIYFVTCIHWFNPLVWLAYHFAVKDMEMACDEETVQTIGMEKKKEYAQALLQLSVGRGEIFAVPLSFSEGSIKDRIKNVLHYQKTVKIAAVMAVAVGILIVVVFMTEGKDGSASADKIQTSDRQKITAGQKKAQDEGIQGTVTGREKTEEKQGELTFEMVRSAFAEKTVGELDFHVYTNGEESYFDDDNALNYYINFTYEYEDEEYLLGVSVSKSTDAIDDIYITRISDKEQTWLYTVEDGKERYPNDLEKLLSMKIEIEDWLTLELPKGYTLGSYQGDLGWAGGACIFPESYKLEGYVAQWTPKERTTSGFVGRMLQVDEIFSFKNGRLQEDSHLLRYNHAMLKETEILDDDSDWQVMMAHWYFDLYTAGDLETLRQEGIEPTETESEYWQFYFVKEGEAEAYYLSLSAKEFSKEEAIAIANTVRMR